MLGLNLAVQGMSFPTENQALLFLRNARKPSCFCRAVMAEKLYGACLWCVIHMILSKSARIFTHYPRVSLVQNRRGSSKWDFAIFPQRNWENFGIYFSSVNSTKFAIFWFTFIQNFDIKKMKRKHSSTAPLRKFLHLGLGWQLEKRNKSHSHWVQGHILLIDCGNDPSWWKGAFFIHKVQTLKY